jgi:two-component system, OmpR family, phosphate regulon sensor histidine kinase PhoR
VHPLRVLLIASLVIAAGVAGAFGTLLHRGGASVNASTVAAVCVFAVFLLPWTGVFLWAVRRAGSIDDLIERSRRMVGGIYDQTITDRPYHGEIDDLARTIEEARSIIVRQDRSFAEQRGVIQQIVSSLGEALLAVDARAKVVFANQQASTLFGVEGALTGRSLLEVARKQLVYAAFDRALHGGGASSERFTVQDGDRERQIEMRVFPVASSAEVAAVAIFIDISTIERLQRMRRDFLDDFSHEVRTPLAGLRAAVESFEAGSLTDSQEEQLRMVMQRQLRRIERLVKDLSELNRIESGEIVLDRTPMDLLTVLREVADDFINRTGGSPARIEVSGDSAWASVDQRIIQVFSNVIDNAIKHGGRDGTVNVEVSRGREGAIVKISDEGEGIPIHETERIFNRFYRVDKSRSQNVPGVGLGLAIAKHLVLAHGGTIRAFNRSGGGATFEIVLPSIDPAPVKTLSGPDFPV